MSQFADCRINLHFDTDSCTRVCHQRFTNLGLVFAGSFVASGRIRIVLNVVFIFRRTVKTVIGTGVGDGDFGFVSNVERVGNDIENGPALVGFKAMRTGRSDGYHGTFFFPSKRTVTVSFSGFDQCQLNKCKTLDHALNIFLLVILDHLVFGRLRRKRAHVLGHVIHSVNRFGNGFVFCQGFEVQVSFCAGNLDAVSDHFKIIQTGFAERDRHCTDVILEKLGATKQVGIARGRLQLKQKKQAHADGNR